LLKVDQFLMSENKGLQWWTYVNSHRPVPVRRCFAERLNWVIARCRRGRGGTFKGLPEQINPDFDESSWRIALSSKGLSPLSSWSLANPSPDTRAARASLLLTECCIGIYYTGRSPMSMKHGFASRY